MHILVLTNEVPYPPIGGAQKRTYYLLRALAMKHDLTLIGFTFNGDLHTPPYPIKVIGVPWKRPLLYEQMNSADATVSQRAYEYLNQIDQPWKVSYWESSVMRISLRQLSQDKFDLILIEGTPMAQYLQFLPIHVPKILNLHDVQTAIARREIEGKTGIDRERAKLEADRTLRFEKLVTLQCQLCLACSKQEAEAATSLLGIEHIAVVPNGVDTAFFTPSKVPSTKGYLLFTGTMNYQPNIEAVKLFAVKILPLIREKFPIVKLHVVGMKPSKEVLALASDDVIVHGAVPDVRPYFQEADIYVAPILHGGGTRLKILEAAASGKAITSTSFAFKRLDFTPGKDLLVADSVTEFASAVIYLIEKGDKKQLLGFRARKVSQNYDWDTIGASFQTLIEHHFE
jgi:glycosyltransferase involved in cell wall biosynthesis